MIRRYQVIVVSVECDVDHCDMDFTGDMDEPMDEVVEYARAVGWRVSGVPGSTRCPEHATEPVDR